MKKIRLTYTKWLYLLLYFNNFFKDLGPSLYELLDDAYFLVFLVSVGILRKVLFVAHDIRIIFIILYVTLRAFLFRLLFRFCRLLFGKSFERALLEGAILPLKIIELNLACLENPLEAMLHRNEINFVSDLLR